MGDVVVVIPGPNPGVTHTRKKYLDKNHRTKMVVSPILYLRPKKAPHQRWFKNSKIGGWLFGNGPGLYGSSRLPNIETVCEYCRHEGCKRVVCKQLFYCRQHLLQDFHLIARTNEAINKTVLVTVVDIPKDKVVLKVDRFLDSFKIPDDGGDRKAGLGEMHDGTLLESTYEVYRKFDMIQARSVYSLIMYTENEADANVDWREEEEGTIFTLVAIRDIRSGDPLKCNVIGITNKRIKTDVAGRESGSKWKTTVPITLPPALEKLYDAEVRYEHRRVGEKRKVDRKATQ